MGEYVSLAEELANLASEAGAKEVDIFSLTLINSYINRFRKYLSLLNECAAYFGNPNFFASIDNMGTSIGKSLANIKIETKTFASRKGGDDILPKELLKDINKKIDTKIQRYQNQEIQLRKESGVANISYNQAITTFLRLLLEASRDIYTLKEKVTDVTEKFVFLYTSSTNNSMNAVSIPIDTFFSKILNNNQFTAIFNMQTLGKFSDWSLRFDTSVTQSVMSQLVNNHMADVLNKEGPMKILTDEGMKDALEFYNNQIKTAEVTNMVTYNALKPEEKADIKNLVNALGYNNLSSWLMGEYQIDRIAARYLVVRKLLTGFLAQEIFNSWINGTKYAYSTDKVAWYKGADVIHNDTGTGYSVKNLISGAPSLFAIGSVKNGLQEIIQALQEILSGKIENIKEYLKTNVFSAAQLTDDTANKDIRNVIDILNPSLF